MSRVPRFAQCFSSYQTRRASNLSVGLGRSRARVLAAIMPLILFDCSKKEDKGDTPPPVVSRAARQEGVCARGGGRATDPVSAAFFPPESGGYCLDPNGDTKAYGQSAPTGIDGVCLEQFDGECELYKGYRLDRLVIVRYVDGKGGSGEVSLALSRFANREGAYGFFTRRVLGGADPLKATTEPLAAGGAGAIGTGVAYLWRGLYVAQLTYSNVSESPEQLKTRSAELLPAMARALGTRLPGELDPPPAVALLPAEGRVKSGIGYDIHDLLGISGVGGGAIGYHQQGERRWRTVAMVKPDEPAAKDVMGTLAKVPGARSDKGVAGEAVSFSVYAPGTKIKTDWMVARRGNTLLGIGDEEFAASEGTVARPSSPTALSREAKIERLKAWIASPAPPASSTRG